MLKDVLTRYGKIAVDTLKESLQKYNVTGKTIGSIKAVIDTLNNRLIITGRPFMSTMETGRGPRKSSNYYNFDKGLQDWLNAKGFPSKTSKKGTKYYKIGESWMSAKSLALRINKDGDKQFRQGHGEKVREVYTATMAKVKEELIQAVKEDQSNEFKNKVLASLK